MSASPLVSVVIVTLNSKKYLFTCLSYLQEQTFQDFEILIIDNGSADLLNVDLQELYPNLDLRIKKLEKNFGFAVANNLGARLSHGKWLALLNADAFPKPDWLSNLTKAATFYPDAFFASRQIQANNQRILDGEGDVLHVSGIAWRHNYGMSSKTLSQVREVFSACGAAAFFLRQDYLDAGGFDEDYFSYHEDVDLGFRLRLQGLTCWLIPEAVVHHVGSASTGKKSDFSIYYGHRNLVWTYFKDMPLFLLWFYLPLHLCMNIFFLLYFTFTGKGSVIWRAKLDAVKGLPAVIQKRNFTQSRRRTSTARIHHAMSRNWLAPLIVFLKRNGA